MGSSAVDPDTKRLDLSESDLSDKDSHSDDGKKGKKKGKKEGDEDALPPVPASQMVRPLTFSQFTCKSTYPLLSVPLCHLF